MKKITTILLLIISLSAATQNIGIRTTTPQGTLDIRGVNNPAVIAGASYATLRLFDNTSGNYNAIELQRQNILTNWSWQAYSHSSNSSLAGMIFKHVNINPVFQVLGNGNTGINTFTPLYPLHISGNSPATGYFNGPDSMQLIVSEGGSQRGYIGATQLYNDNRDIEIGTVSGNTGSLHLAIKQAPKLTILNNGNIGVGGIANPQNNMVIAGGVVVDQNNTNDGVFHHNKMLVFGSADEYLGGSSQSREGIGSKRNSGEGQYSLDFFVNENILMNVANNGNVGVGTLTATRKLETPATLSAQRLKTSHGNFPILHRRKTNVNFNQFNNWSRESFTVSFNNSFTSTNYRVLVGLSGGRPQSVYTYGVTITGNNSAVITVFDNNPYVPGNIGYSYNVDVFVMAMQNY